MDIHLDIHGYIQHYTVLCLLLNQMKKFFKNVPCKSKKMPYLFIFGVGKSLDIDSQMSQPITPRHRHSQPN